MSTALNSLLRIKEPGLYETLPAETRLGLAFSKGIASLCLADKSNAKVIAYEQWSCPDQEFHTQIIETADALATSNTWLSQPGIEMIITVDAAKFLMVPATLYDAHKKETYLNLQYTAEPYGEWTYQDALDSLDAFLVYALPLSVENRIRSAFPNAIIRHAKTFLLEKLLGIVNRRQLPDLGVIHVQKESLDVIIFKAGKLSFFNTFSYQTFDDLVYFTLLALDDSRISADQFPLQICGNFAYDNDLLERLKSFVPGLIPLEIKDYVKTANVFQKTPLHTLFPLIDILS